jgi:hypothetical protein
MSRRDDLASDIIGGLTASDRARLARGITIGALVGAAIAGSLLRARRARRRPRPLLRVETVDAGVETDSSGLASSMGAGAHVIGEPGERPADAPSAIAEPGADAGPSPIGHDDGSPQAG